MATRAEVVKIAKKYIGAKQGSKKHKDLVNTFNKVRPHGEVGNYTCAWCAIAYTAFLIKAGMTRKQAPMSYNCGRLIEDAKALGIWVENDAYVPKKGDGIIYYWNDSGKGDCRSGASHVGTVEKVNKKKRTITVIEGNKGTTHAGEESSRSMADTSEGSSCRSSIPSRPKHRRRKKKRLRKPMRRDGKSERPILSCQI